MPRRLTVDDVRAIALALPDTSERPCYGTPGFYVKKTLFARVKEDGVSIVVKMDFDQRDAMVEAMPDIFAVTPHYQDYPMVIVQLATVGRGRLKDLLAGARLHAATGSRSSRR